MKRVRIYLVLWKKRMYMTIKQCRKPVHQNVHSIISGQWSSEGFLFMSLYLYKLSTASIYFIIRKEGTLLLLHTLLPRNGIDSSLCSACQSAESNANVNSSVKPISFSISSSPNLSKLVLCLRILVLNQKRSLLHHSRKTKLLFCFFFFL